MAGAGGPSVTESGDTHDDLILAFLDQSRFRIVAGYVQELPNEEAILASDQAITPTLQLFLKGVGSGLGEGLSPAGLAQTLDQRIEAVSPAVLYWLAVAGSAILASHTTVLDPIAWSTFSAG
jgi:hypothetical protein